MKKNTPRRDFLTKLSLGVSSVFAMTAFSGNAKRTNEPMETTEKKAVKKIKALGFQWETADPFLFCVHHEDFYPAGNDDMGPDRSSLEGRDIGQDFLIKDGWRMYHGSKVPGFPRHPHRGFETITVVRKGMIDHTDSLGGAGRYGGGDVQWMTAGKGVQHAEMFPLINKDSDNPLELFQIWINLPKAKKFSDASYKMLWSETIPSHSSKDDNGKTTKVSVTAGQLADAKAPSPPPDSWANDPKNSTAIWTITMEPGATWKLPAAEAGLNRTLYFFQGSSMKAAGTDIPTYHAAELHSDMEVLLQNGDNESELLMLQGRPIAEPVVQHGPFVMNTKEEITQAFQDFQETEFGGWPLADSDPVHPRDKGRFAIHIDGREETPGS